MDVRELVQRLPQRSRLYLATAVYGIAGGGVAVAFHQGIHWLYEGTIEAWAAEAPGSFAWRSLLLMLGASLVSGWLVAKMCPEAAGSGIPQLKLAFWKEFGWTSPRIVLVKFVAGVLSIGSGMSLGREGPSVQLAGTLGSAIAGRLGVAKMRHRMPAAAGAAAGLAAAFNTPLAAVTFVLEEIIGDLNSRFLGNVLMASVIGALVAHGLLGAAPALHILPPDEPGWAVYLLVPWCAVCATLTGLLFQHMSVGLRGWMLRQNQVPRWILPSVAALLTWGLGVLVWKSTGRLGVFSLGYHDLSDALSGRLVWQMAALLLATKFLATVACYGLGGCGGIFSPTLFLGGMAGLVAAGLGGMILPVGQADMVVLAVVGMCASLGAVVRAPVTGILIVFEMTHQFSLVLPLMLGALVSQAVSRRLMKHNFYDAILEQDGHHMSRLMPPRDLESWQQLPASTIANFHPVTLTDLSMESLEAAFERFSFSHFPVAEQGRITGVLTRRAMEHALLSGAAPELEPAIKAGIRMSIRELQTRIIESRTGMVLLCDEKDSLLGIVTLHDLLRAQIAFGAAKD